MRRLALMALLVFGLLLVTGSGAVNARAPLSISVSGNKLVDGQGSAIVLHGVNRSSFEYACAHGSGFHDDPSDAAVVAAIKTWKVNVVRVPLNEACWLGLPSVAAAYRGAAYQNAVAGFVKQAHAAGLYVILDLHWNAPGNNAALGQQVMADADHSPTFWKSVASKFINDHAVIFDLYNEPHDISWQCWRNGCTTSDGWKTAGMKTLLLALRSTGATQPVMLGGLGWGSDLSQNWADWKPSDPAGQLIASIHTYKSNQYGTSGCQQTCRAQIAWIARKIPVVTGEFGEDDCAHGFVDDYMNWADQQKVSYLGWTWNVWDCRSGPALIRDYSGTPTSYGAGLKSHLASLP